VPVRPRSGRTERSDPQGGRARRASPISLPDIANCVSNSPSAPAGHSPRQTIPKTATTTSAPDLPAVPGAAKRCAASRSSLQREMSEVAKPGTSSKTLTAPAARRNAPTGRLEANAQSRLRAGPGRPWKPGGSRPPATARNQKPATSQVRAPHREQQRRRRSARRSRARPCQHAIMRNTNLKLPNRGRHRWCSEVCNTRRQYPLCRPSSCTSCASLQAASLK
jgi:hypothetical protein